MEERDGATTERVAGGDPSPAPGTPATFDAAVSHQRIISDLYWAKCDAAHCELPEKLPKVWEYCQRHAAAGRNWHRCYALKLLELWEFLQAEKPRTILELGSGCTTAVFMEYQRATGAKFLTVDENREFQRQVIDDIGLDAFPMALGLDKYDEKGCCSYVPLWRMQIAHDVDVLYVDGPSNKQADGTFAICLDACNLKDYPPKAILFDIRRETVLHTRQFYGDKYHWDASAWGQSETPWYLSAIRHHTIARRRA